MHDHQRIHSLDTASAFAQLLEELRRDHERLDSLLTAVAEEARRNDAARLQATWTAFERCLTAHLQREEQKLLPLLDRSHPQEVRSILREHERLREQVGVLGVQIDLHTVRREPLTRLGRMLHVHARAEERGLYHWLTSTARPA